MATTFEVVQLIVENSLQLAAVVLLISVTFRPEILKHVSKLKFGEFELEMRELQERIGGLDERVEELQEDLELERRQLARLLESYDVDAPVSELKPFMQAAKAYGRTTDNLDELHRLLGPDAAPEELMVAAVSLREKRSPELFDDLVACLDRLARDPELLGIRLNTVYMLTSALHRVLLASVRDGVPPTPTPEQLQAAAKTLSLLEKNPRVQADRPDAPKKGVRGPLSYAQKWIEKGLTTSQTG